MKRFCHQVLKPRYNRVVLAALSSSAHFKNAAGALNLDRELILYGSKKQTPVSLKSLLETGKGDLLNVFEGKQRESTTASELVLFQVACFLHRELPVRVAHRVEHLQSAPFLLNSRKFLCISHFYRTVAVLIRLFHSQYPVSVRSLQEHLRSPSVYPCSAHS